jgi:hypothetical protein
MRRNNQRKYAEDEAAAGPGGPEGPEEAEAENGRVEQRNSTRYYSQRPQGGNAPTIE